MSQPYAAILCSAQNLSSLISHCNIMERQEASHQQKQIKTDFLQTTFAHLLNCNCNRIILGMKRTEGSQLSRILCG
ncbi:hypothetical protein PsAD2_04245 [Pseudovibrio axinellae]|uniref:Uncharacterized protein n=1 Tax=Pseudovibrio axinellae TaxID=989403 RepID=A0A165TWP9_9HYPH|nr:hypothetical protein PsAD2_04245 [Pseudovibrio axinellae]SER62206.1 hypothetical protein SAMN05421798_11457 [Pseudovibrio axinellae]